MRETKRGCALPKTKNSKNWTCVCKGATFSPTHRTETCPMFNKLIIANELPDAAVYGVKQYDYTVDGIPGQDYIAALTVASFREAVAIEDATGAYADVVRVRNRKVEDLGFVLSAISQAISTMDPKSNNTDKKSDKLSSLYDARDVAAKYGITISLAEISGNTASITYRNATTAQNDVEYAMDTEDNNLQQDMVSLQSFISKRDNAYSTASKIVKKAANNVTSTLGNIV